MCGPGPFEPLLICGNPVEHTVQQQLHSAPIFLYTGHDHLMHLQVSLSIDFSSKQYL